MNTTDITNPALGKTLNSYLSGPSTFFDVFLPRFITIGWIVGVLFFVYYFMTGAIQVISSEGDKTSLENARHKITHAIVGLVVLFALFAFLRVVETVFGIKILTLDIGALLIQ